MNLWEMILLGLGLSMDAAAVSMTNGMCIKNVNYKHALAIAAAFGSFQGIMPALGYFAGSMFSQWINGIDHWLALILLGFIGGKMVFEAITAQENGQCIRSLDLRLLMAQAIATSIDALAVGVSFAALQTPILPACSIIALLTFLCSAGAVYIGKRFGDVLNSKAEIVGGVVLVAIGLKIFISHSAV